MKAIYIEWEDSSSFAGGVWSIREDCVKSKPCSCKTIGFVISETKDAITLAGSLDGGKHVSGDMTIPKSAIRKRRVVSWK